jgi:hypothetical protein
MVVREVDLKFLDSGSNPGLVSFIIPSSHQRARYVRTNIAKVQLGGKISIVGLKGLDAEKN